MRPSQCSCDSGGSLSEIVNFHLTRGGDLEKRSGYRLLSKMSSSVRACWSGTVKGTYTCIFACGAYVFSVNVSTGAITKIGNLATSSGHLSFFLYEGELYVKDSVTLLKLYDTSSIGYVPLYGKNWGTSYYGEVYQPLNLMHRRVRISYSIPTTHTAMLPTKHPVKTIYALYRNGVLVDPTGYVFDADFNTINVQDISSGDKFVAVLEYTTAIDDTFTSAFSSSVRSAVVGGGVGQRICVWGSSAAPHSMLVSSPVSADDLKQATGVGITCNTLYFPREGQVTTGNGRGEIKAVISHYDRLLVFGEYEAWMTDSVISEGNSIKLMSINANVGCFSATGYTKAGDLPITVGRHGIYKWVYRSGGSAGFEAVCISDPIASSLGKVFFGTCSVYHDPLRNEVLFNSTRGDGNVFVYNLDTEGWTKFTNVPAINFFDGGGITGFFRSQHVFLFDETIDTDCGNTGETTTAVNAYVITPLITFGTELPKRLTSFTLSGDLNGNSAVYTVSADNGKGVRRAILDSTEAVHSSISQRLGFRRIRSFKVSVGASRGTGITIHDFSIKAITPRISR